ncbi:MAG: hypothetical protein LQ343_001770 [Gyalolechia ehrenbergii]|nr:MAG: hypothetical protein LQ343_001770 [Gyalolechia ehrenbergii]
MKSMANGQAVSPCIKRKSQHISELAHAHPEQLPAIPAVPNSTRKGDPQAPTNTNGCSSPYPVPDQGLSALLEGQRKDIDRITANVGNLLQDMKTVRASMEYLKFQQKTFETFTDNEVAKSPATLTADLQNLTDRISQVSSKVDRVHALTEGLNELTKRVSQVSTGANEVDGLKLELKLMKQRIKRLENMNANSQASNLASKSEASFPLDMQRKSEPICNDPVISQEVPSSTRSHSEHTSAHFRRSASTVSLEESGLQYVSDSAPDKPLDQSQYSNDRDMTPSSNLVELLQPQITSAEKVAAQKRRRSQSSSSSSSSSPANPSRNRRPANRPRIYNKPDWNTKPRFDTTARRKLTSLNDPEHVLTSDPEDSDYDPNSLPQDLTSLQQTKDLFRIRRKHPQRLPTPEWEKPDWENPYLSTSTRGHSTARRGVSGRGAITSNRRRSSGFYNNTNNNEYVYAQSPDYWDDEQRLSGTPDNFFAKPRDSQGRLLRPDGRVDGRSLRHQRERAARAKLAAMEGLKARVGQQENSDGTTMMQSAGNFVDSAALAAAGYGNGKGNGVMVGGQLDGTGNADGRVDGDVDQMAANRGDAGAGIKQEDGAGVPTTTPSTIPPAVAAPGQGGEAHAKLMGQVFPWR